MWITPFIKKKKNSSNQNRKRSEIPLKLEIKDGSKWSQTFERYCRYKPKDRAAELKKHAEYNITYYLFT